MAMLKREYGGIQPCWKVGLFRIRLPFIHFKISPPEVVTGLMNACTSYGALAVLITSLVSTLQWLGHWLYLKRQCTP